MEIDDKEDVVRVGEIHTVVAMGESYREEALKDEIFMVEKVRAYEV